MKNLSLLALVVLAVVGGWWLLGRDTGSTAPTDLVGPELEQKADAKARKSATEAAAPDTIESRSPGGERALVASDAASPLAASTRVPDAIEGPTRDYQVVARATGAPVAGAGVYFFDEVIAGRFAPAGNLIAEFGSRSKIAPLITMLSQEGIESALPHLAEARYFETDAEGRVQVPASNADTLVLVQSELWRGYALTFGTLDTGERIVVDTPKSLVVKTIDETGAPVAHVPLSAPLDRWPRPLVAPQTDVNGTWTLFEANTLATAFALASRELDALEGDVALAVRTPVAGDQATVNLVQPRPLTFTCPSPGLRIVALDHQGEPWSAPEAWFVVSGLGPTRWLPVEGGSEPGVVELGGIAEGTEVSVSLSSKSAFTSVQRPEPVAGIVNAWGLELVLRLGAPSSALLTFRAVDVNHAPLAHFEFDFEESFTNTMRMRNSGSGRVMSGKDGRVQRASNYLNSLAEDVGTYRLELAARLGARDASSGLVALAAEPILLSGAQEWPLDLGDIVFTEVAPLVAGRVVDADGAPVKHARVEVRRQGDNSPTTIWIPGVYTDAEGRFEVFSEDTGALLDVSAEHQSHGQARRSDVTSDTLNLELELIATGGLELSVDTNHPSPAAGVVVRVQPMAIPEGLEFSPSISGTMSMDGTWWWTPFKADGTALWESMVAGVYHVQLFDGAVVLADWEGVVVEGGEITRDPRMQGLRLGDFYLTVEIDAVDASGAPIEGAESARAGESLSWSGNRMLPVTELPVDVLVRAPGYLTASARVTESFARVQLDEAPTIKLRLPFDVPSSSTAWASLALAPEEGELDAFGSASSWAKVTGNTAEVTVRGLGRQEVLLRTTINHGNSSSTSSRPLPMGADFVLEVGPNDDGRVFVLDVPKEDWALFGVE